MLYDVNGITSAVTAIEISANGAKLTAKLVECLVGLISLQSVVGLYHDEL